MRRAIRSLAPLILCVGLPGCGGSPSGGAGGFAVFPCTDAHATPSLRIAHVEVRVRSLANAPTSATLVALVEVEPLNVGGPSKDSTLANLGVTVTAGEGTGPTG